MASSLQQYQYRQDSTGVGGGHRTGLVQASQSDADGIKGDCPQIPLLNRRSGYPQVLTPSVFGDDVPPSPPSATRSTNGTLIRPHYPHDPVTYGSESSTSWNAPFRTAKEKKSYAHERDAEDGIALREYGSDSKRSDNTGDMDDPWDFSFSDETAASRVLTKPLLGAYPDFVQGNAPASGRSRSPAAHGSPYRDTEYLNAECGRGPSDLRTDLGSTPFRRKSAGSGDHSALLFEEDTCYGNGSPHLSSPSLHTSPHHTAGAASNKSARDDKKQRDRKSSRRPFPGSPLHIEGAGSSVSGPSSTSDFIVNSTSRVFEILSPSNIHFPSFASPVLGSATSDRMLPKYASSWADRKSLILAFIAGLLVASMLGLFRGTEIANSSNPPVLSSSPTSSKLSSWIPFNPASWTSTSASVVKALTLDPRPPYVHHRSGHIFMDQTRVALSAIDHPIHALVANASRRWDELLQRQSKSLPEAAREYRRRYGRHPPKGFERWYKFATDNNVILVDEYDQISRDVLPFQSLSRDKLRERMAEVEVNDFTHTFVVKDGKITITGAKKELARASDQADLMKNFIHLLPDVNITMSAHDGPSVMMNWELQSKHVKAAKEGKIVNDVEADNPIDDVAQFGWNLACPPSARIRSAYDGLEVGRLPPGPSFIEDHRQSMDMCENPEWQYMHGFTAWQGPRPRHLQPLFSFSKTSMHSDLLCVPLEQWLNMPKYDPEWEDKKYDQILWRGSMTGVWYDAISWWRSSQRSRLHFLSYATEGSRYVRFTEMDGGNEKVVEREVEMKALNNRYLNVSYAGTLHQCTPEDGSCDAIPPLIQTQPQMDWESQNDYKYIFDMDGNAWSGRFHRLMASNALVLKSTMFPEWYSERIMPWYHFVPVKIDYSDVYDIMAFFSGDMDMRGNHDAMAKKIAYQGKDWTKKHWRWADMETYAFRLYLEWARIVAYDQSNVDYTG